MSLRTSPTEEVVKKVNELGLKAAAKHLEIDPSTLYRWLKRQGYKSKHQYVKENQNTQQFQTL